MRLINADNVEKGFEELCRSPYFKEDASARLGAETLMDLCVRSDSHKPNTVDPESMPIVKELRKELRETQIKLEGMRTTETSLKMHLKTGSKIDIEKSAKNILDRVQQKLGISAEQLMDLVQAYQNGRFILHPLKADDEVYILLLGSVLQFEVTSAVWYGGIPAYKAMHGLHLCFVFNQDDIGKTVFLTREAAEAALKGEQQ